MDALAWTPALWTPGSECASPWSLTVGLMMAVFSVLSACVDGPSLGIAQAVAPPAPSCPPFSFSLLGILSGSPLQSSPV